MFLFTVNGQTCEFCLMCQLDSLDNPFAYMPAKPVGCESEVDLIQVCNLKRRPSFSQSIIWSPIFGHINTTFSQVTDDALFFWRSNTDYTEEVVGPLFILMGFK